MSNKAIQIALINFIIHVHLFFASSHLFCICIVITYPPVVRFCYDLLFESEDLDKQFFINICAIVALQSLYAGIVYFFFKALGFYFFWFFEYAFIVSVSNYPLHFLSYLLFLIFFLEFFDIILKADSREAFAMGYIIIVIPRCFFFYVYLQLFTIFF
jgi:hypothetical protein